MLLTPRYISPKKQYQNDLKEIGIRKCSRTLIFFVDKTEYELGIVQTGKAVQINLSAEAGKVNDFMRSVGSLNINSATVKNTVYTYSVYFENGINDFDGTLLMLEDAYSIDQNTDFDESLNFNSTTGIYDKNVSTTEGKMENMMKSMMFKASEIPLPQYYTNDHQIEKEKEFYSIIWSEEKMVFEGHELIDPYTRIEIRDIKSWDTMIPMLQHEIQMKSARRAESNSINFISDLFLPTTESMLSGIYSFIYDSQLGINVKPLVSGSKIPLGEFRLKENMISQLQHLKDLVLMQAKCIEAEKGNIRLYYVPMAMGDKLDIKFLDYNPDNQPDFNKSKIGKEYTIREEATRIVNDAIQEDFNYQLEG